jgi:ADP-heptose:LPS heptosyltransferase
MSQKISLAADGVCIPARMQAYTSGQASNPPKVRISRLQELLRTQKPKICIVRGEGIGDVITTTPTVHAIKRQFKSVHLTYATNTKYLDGALVNVLKYNPDIDHIIERQMIKDSDYDLVISLHCPCISHEVARAKPISRIDLFANYLGLVLLDPVPRYYLQQEEIDAARMITDKFRSDFIQNRVVLVQPSASASRRSMPHSVLKDACIGLGRRNIKTVILTHSTDNATNTLWDNIPGSFILKDKNIREIAAIANSCNLVLCPDSSILHLAGALRLPTVGLFGPTPPDARINHYQNATAIWHGEGIPACPCYYSVCPIREKCWASITSNEIVEKCISHLELHKRIDDTLVHYKDEGILVDMEII